MGTTARRDEIRVFAPASIANLGPGFDSLGIALAELGDTIEARRTRDGDAEVVIAAMTGAAAGIPLETDRNCAGRAATAVFERLPRGAVQPGRIELRIHKGMPGGSGLGSSACSAVAGALAAQQLCGAPLTEDRLLEAALEGEAVAAGEPHADNVAPSLLGGFTVVRSHHPLAVIRLDAPAALRLIVVLPEMEIATRDARAILPRTIPLADAAFNWAHAGALVAAVAQGKIAEIGQAVADRVVEPVRAELIPGFYDVKRAALGAGAHGCSISGAGPSLFAIGTESSGEAIGRAMQAAFRRHGLASTYHVCAPENRGARPID